MSTILLAWPYAGVGLAVLMIAWLALEKRNGSAPARWQDPAWVLPLLWPMYLVHQFEEHGVDLLGRHYSFLGELCGTLGYAQIQECPADRAFIFAVNAIGCQMAFAMSWIFRRRNPLVAACAWGIPLVNAVTHVAGAVTHRAYNPGVATSLILFAPLSAWMLRTALRSGMIERSQVLRIVASGVVIHAVLVGSLLLRAQGWLSHEALLFLNAANGLWPLAFGWVGVKRIARLA
jgi:hypothetical protein